MRSISLIVVICALATSPTQAADLRVWLDPETVQTGKTCYLMIQAKGSSLDNPILPEVDGLTISSSPAIRQTYETRINFEREITIVRGYPLRARRAGKYTIPPVKITIDGHSYENDPLTLTATDEPPPPPNLSSPDSPPPSSPTMRPTHAENPRPDDSRALDWDDMLIAEATTDKTTVYLNEPILLTLKQMEIVHRQIQVRTAQPADPTTEGFYVIGAERRNPRSHFIPEDRNGLSYRANETYRVLYPTKTGDLTIGPWECAGVARVLQDFHFIEQEIKASSQPIHITVKPLPPSPETFTGAVGQFIVEADLTDDQVVQGVPTKLVLKITGPGNPNAIGQPHLPSLDWGTFADPHSEARSVQAPDGVVFEKSFTFGVTPIQSGSLRIPAFDFSFFDPEREEYVTKTLGPFPLEVIPAKGGEEHVLFEQGSATGPPEQIDVVSADISPPAPCPEKLRKTAHSIGTTGTLATMPVIGYAVFAVLLSRKRRFENDTVFARAHRAHAVGKKRLRTVHASDDPAEELYRALASFIADKLGHPGGGITSADVGGMLKQEEVPQDLLDRLTKVLRTCERARYASAKLSDTEMAALIQGASTSMDELAAHLKKGRRP